MALTVGRLIFVLVVVYSCVYGFQRSSNMRRNAGINRLKSFSLKGTRKDAVPYPGYGKKKSSGRSSNQVPKKEYEDLEEGHEEVDVTPRDEGTQSSVVGQIKLATEERINKVLARAGVASRRGADDILLANRVMVNGKLVNEPGFKVNVKKDVIVVDGERISLPDDKNTYWVAINKPKNVITSMDDDKDRETLSSLVPKSKDLRIVPVGRLERDTTGIIVLTNEVGWLHPLTHRSYKRQGNRYEVVVQGLVAEDKIERLKRGGVEISRDYDIATGAASNSYSEGGGYQRRHTKSMRPDAMDRLPPVTVKIIDADARAKLTLLEVSMEELLPQQMQRLCAQTLECPLVSIKRTEFGPVKLGALKRGQWREMSVSEVAKLKGSVFERDVRDEEMAQMSAVFDLEEGQYEAGRSSRSFQQNGATPRGRASVGNSRKRPGAGYASRVAALGGNPNGGERTRDDESSYRDKNSGGRGRRTRSSYSSSSSGGRRGG